MKKSEKRKIVAGLFMLIALVLGVLFYSSISVPSNIEGYFKAEYYNQLGPIAISIELLTAGWYLWTKPKKANFALALFGFTVLLDFVFSLTGLFDSPLPLYAAIIFGLCMIYSLWLAFTNTFDIGKISFWGVLISFLLGNAIELFFNFWLS